MHIKMALQEVRIVLLKQRRVYKHALALSLIIGLC